MNSSKGSGGGSRGGPVRMAPRWHPHGCAAHRQSHHHGENSAEPQPGPRTEVRVKLLILERDSQVFYSICYL